MKNKDLINKLKIEHDYECDNCNKPAEIEIAYGVIQKYEISPRGDLNLFKEEPAEEAEFYCRKCYDNRYS